MVTETSQSMRALVGRDLWKGDIEAEGKPQARNSLTMLVMTYTHLVRELESSGQTKANLRPFPLPPSLFLVVMGKGLYPSPILSKTETQQEMNISQSEWVHLRGRRSLTLVSFGRKSESGGD